METGLRPRALRGKGGSTRGACEAGQKEEGLRQPCSWSCSMQRERSLCSGGIFQRPGFECVPLTAISQQLTVQPSMEARPGQLPSVSVVMGDVEKQVARFPLRRVSRILAGQQVKGCSAITEQPGSLSILGQDTTRSAKCDFFFFSASAQRFWIRG